MQVSQTEMEIAKKLIEKMNEFNNNYKKRAKKDRKGSGQDQSLLSPNMYQVRRSFS